MNYEMCYNRITFHKSKIQSGQKSDMDLIQSVLLVTWLLKQKPGNLQRHCAFPLMYAGHGKVPPVVMQ